MFGCSCQDRVYAYTQLQSLRQLEERHVKADRQLCGEQLTNPLLESSSPLLLLVLNATRRASPGFNATYQFVTSKAPDILRSSEVRDSALV